MTGKITRPAPRDRPWRTGRKLGRTLYIQMGDQPSDDDPCIGMLDSAELAQRAVAAVNAELGHRHG